MPFGITGSVLGLIGSGLQASAAKKAAELQSQSVDKALDFSKNVFSTQQQNQAPYQQAGVESIGTLMQALRDGKFGAGSNSSTPTFTPPTLQDARNDPGYEFTREQGTRGVLQGAAAAGGAITGGTLKALDTFGSGLADTTYGNVFNRSLQSYNAHLSGYQTDLAKQAQEYQQMFAPAQLGENAVASINNTGTAQAVNIGQLMTSQGTAQSAGVIGAGNAWASGLSNAGNSIQDAYYGRKGTGKAAPSAPADWAIPG